MKRNLLCFLVIAIYLSSFFSCQPELAEDGIHVSAGSLMKEPNGVCSPINVAGSYIAGVALGDTNYIEVEVNVTSPGTYSINTDVINGYSFKATGNFTATGIKRIKLAGAGKPIAVSADNFTVSYGSSTCNVSVVIGNGTVTIPVDPAVFTLQGSPGNCMNAVVSGTYAKGKLLSADAKVNIDVNVTTAGTYSISTNSINGYSFSSIGTFLSTGVQTVSLTGSGTPVDIGTNIFTVTATTTSCTFSVTVLDAVIVVSNDHFPLTTNSYWTYDDLFSPPDTLKRSISDSVAIGGRFYKVIKEELKSGSPRLYNCRKVGNDYFEYCSADKYTGSFQYLKAINVDFPFLKENLNTGDSWSSDEYSDTATFGQVITLRYVFSCSDAHATVTINGKAFTEVYKIVMQPQIKSIGNPYGFTAEVFEYYYAAGVGVIYAKQTTTGFTQFEWQIRNWLVK